MTRRRVVALIALVALLAFLPFAEGPMPGWMVLFSFAATVVLVLGGKSVLAPLIQRPVGTRVGELGDPADEIADAVDDDDPAVEVRRDR
jgi:RsiW-degrading membrane proteinase PrsW (M82 family)